MALRGVPVEPPVDPPPADELPEPNFDAQEAPPARVIRGLFDSANISVGDVILFKNKRTGGEEKRLTVVSVAPKSVLGDVEGKPDQRVKFTEITGYVAKD